MAKEQKVYMPLMIGDWLKGTRGMKAEIRGVYLNLLLYQWDNGFIPSDMEELCLIDPELPKVWVKLKDKFIEVEPGKLQNKKNEEVRDFWKKQKKNGGKGGRPKNDNPKVNPNQNPTSNPNTNHHNDLDLDNEVELKVKKELKEKANRQHVVNDPRETKIDFLRPDIDGDDIVFPIDTPATRDLWSVWKKYRWEKYNLRYGMMGEQADLKRFEGMTFSQIEATILAAISNGWKNLYPDKHQGNGRNSTNKKQEQTRNAAAYVADHYAEKLGRNKTKPGG